MDACATKCSSTCENDNTLTALDLLSVPLISLVYNKMKLTQRQLFEEIRCMNPHNRTIAAVTARVAEKLEIDENDHLKDCIKEQLMIYNKESSKMHKKSHKERTDIGSLEVKIDSEDYKRVSIKSIVPIESDTPPSKKKRKLFRDLNNKSRLERSQHLVDALKIFSEDESLSVNETLGYLLYRLNHMPDKNMSRLGFELFSGLYKEHSFDLMEAIAIMHTMTLSKHQIRLLKRIIEAKGIHFPSTTELLDARKKLHPVISTVLAEKGVKVDYKELVKTTVIAQIEVLEHKNIDVTQYSDLKMTFKDGCDGAGQQVTWKSTKLKDAAENMFQYGLVPLELISRNEVLWKNAIPNSPNVLRPVYLIREKESDSEMIQLVIRTTDTAREELKQNGLDVDVSGTSVHIDIEIKDTMKDLKLKKAISGLGGADCIICDSRQVDWTNEEKITKGFPINRNSEETLALYNILVTDDGEIPVQKGDFETRKGLTKEPITTSDQHSITITHSYINITTWFLKVLYRVNAEYFVWTESKTVLGEHIRRGKDRVFEIIKNDTGLVLDIVCSGGAKGGTSTDGKQGRRFFSEELVPTLKKSMKTKYHPDLLEVHALLSAILRVVSSQQLVNLDVYEENCKRLSLLIARQLKWVKIIHTLHGLLHHSAELIALNNGYALGSLSEEGLEATNKFIRRFLELLARKTSPTDQLMDVMARLLERSNPLVAHTMEMLKKNKVVPCSHCESKEHSSNQHMKATSFGPNSYYDTLVNSMIYDKFSDI